MACEGIKIENVTLRCEPHCDYVGDDQQRIRFEEDRWAAREVLGRLVCYVYPRVPEPWEGKFPSWQSYLMFLYKPVAKHYGLDADDLLHYFNKHYLPTLVFKYHGEIWLPKTEGTQGDVQTLPPQDSSVQSGE